MNRPETFAVDLSHWNRSVNFDELRDAGCVLVYLKATEGRTHVDPVFHERREQAKAAGLVVGAYHYCRPDLGNSARAEAEHMLTTIGQPQPGSNLDAPPVLDLERRDWKPGWRGQYADGRRSWLLAGLQYLRRSYEYLPGAYLGTSYLRHQLGGGEWHLRGAAWLWIKRYWNNAETPGDGQCGAWEDNGLNPPWTMYQYTNKGAVPGVLGDCDVNALAPDWRARMGLRA